MQFAVWAVSPQLTEVGRILNIVVTCNNKYACGTTSREYILQAMVEINLR